MFESFKNQDKIWIYTASEELNASQIETIDGYASNFLYGWESHGSSVKGSIKIYYKRFIVIVSDDCNGSMCGRAQDAQLKLMQELERELGISFVDRMLLGYKKDGKVEVVAMAEFQKLLAAGDINSDTIVYNNLITQLGQFESEWEVPMKESWHQSMLR